MTSTPDADDAGHRVAPSADTSVVYVDWDNLRHGAWQHGFVVDPVVLLKVAVRLITERRPDVVWPPGEIRLYCSSELETHLDRHRIRNALSNGRVELCLVPDAKNMADIEIAIDAVTEGVSDPSSHIIIVSGDNDLARVAQALRIKFADADKGGMSVLGHLLAQPPKIIGNESPQKTRRFSLGGLFGRNLEAHAVRAARRRLDWKEIGARPRNRWDTAAWALRTTFESKIGIAAPQAFLSDVDDEWWKKQVLGRDSLSSPEVEALDSVLAQLGSWALYGPPLAKAKPHRMAPLGERIVANCPLIAPEDADEVVVALRESGFLRHTGRQDLALALYSFEGVLFPIRRALLLVPRAPAPHQRCSATELNFKRGVPKRSGLSAPEKDRFGEVGDEEWKMVSQAMVRRLRAVAVLTDQGHDVVPRQWQGRAAHAGRFADATFETAAHLLTFVDEPRPKNELLELFHSAGVPRGAGWHRTLAEAKLIKKIRGDDSRWVLGDVRLGDGAGAAQP